MHNNRSTRDGKDRARQKEGRTERTDRTEADEKQKNAPTRFAEELENWEMRNGSALLDQVNKVSANTFKYSVYIKL